MFRPDAELEHSITDKIGKTIGSLKPIGSFGSLAAGADILFAEFFLNQNCDLSIFLHNEPEHFIVESVLPLGESWVPRFKDCLNAADVFVTGQKERTAGDEKYANTTASALDAMSRQANLLGLGKKQIALSDGIESGAAAGTSADIKQWRHTGGETLVIPFSRS